MPEEFKKRLEFLRGLLEQPWIRTLLIIWALSGVWDLALGEWIPEKYSTRLPRIYQVVSMTAGFLPWQMWLLVGLGILVLSIIEYLFRRSTKDGTSGHTPSYVDVKKFDVPFWVPVSIAIALIVAYGIVLVHQNHAELQKVTSSTVAPSNDPTPAPKAPPGRTSAAPQKEGNSTIVASASLLYDAQANTLSKVSSDGIKDISIESLPSDGLLAQPTSILVRFWFSAHHEGPFDVSFSFAGDMQALWFGRENYKILENDPNYVSVLVSQSGMYSLGGSHLVDITFNKKK